MTMVAGITWGSAMAFLILATIGLIILMIFVGIPLRIIIGFIGSRGGKRSHCESCGRHLKSVSGRWGEYHSTCSRCGTRQSWDLPIEDLMKRAPTTLRKAPVGFRNVSSKSCGAGQHDRCQGRMFISQRQMWVPCGCSCGHLGASV